jgi:predicted metal-dependent peptidase
MDIDQQATDRVAKARAELIMARRFYGVLVSNVEPTLSREFPTMATDGKRHYFNPEFVCSLTQQELLAVQAHESEHDARHHGTRRQGRDPMDWNIACDYAINIDLVDQGFKLPEGALIDARYRGMSAEDIYRSRELDQKSSGDGDSSGAGADGDGEPGQPGSPDPGQCGQVLDAATDPGKAAEIDNKWERVTRQAAAMAKAVGQLPGHVAREIERANKPARDWRDELREFAEQGSLRIETWNRPNRRFASRGLVLPSSQKDGIGKAAFVIDTSGSMDDEALASVRNEAQAMLDDGVIDEAVVIYGDTRVTRVDHFYSADQIEFDPQGGGGTDLKPLFKYVADEVADASVLICFTDLMIGDPGPEPHCPVLFAVTGYPDHVRRMIASAPWGARGIDVGAR